MPKWQHRPWLGGALRNISFHNTEIVEAGIAVNVDLGVCHPGAPHGTNTSRLSTVDGLSVVNLTAVGSIGCRSHGQCCHFDAPYCISEYPCKI